MIVGLVGAFLTAAYMTRCVYLTFFGEYRGGDHEADVARVRLRAGRRWTSTPRRRADGRGGRRHVRDGRGRPDGHVPTPCWHEDHGHDATTATPWPATAAGHGGHDEHVEPHESPLAASRCRSSSSPFLAVDGRLPEQRRGHPHDREVHRVGGDQSDRRHVPDRSTTRRSTGATRCCRSSRRARRGRRRTSSCVALLRATSPLAGLTRRNRLAGAGYAFLVQQVLPRRPLRERHRRRHQGARSPRRAYWFNQNVHRRHRQRRRHRRPARPATGSTRTSTRRSSTVPSTAAGVVAEESGSAPAPGAVRQGPAVRRAALRGRRHRRARSS